MRLVALALVTILVAAVWFALAAIWFTQRRAMRKVVREEIAAADAAWDQKVTGLDPIDEMAYQRGIARFRKGADDPEAVAAWLWTEGRA